MFTSIIETNEKRNGLQSYLKDRGIMTKVYFEPIHLKSLYRNYGYKEGCLPKTEDLSKHVLTLPLYVGMPKEEMDFIISNIKRFFKR